MAGGVGSLEQTPTWSVAVVCFVLVAISIAIEHLIHATGKWLMKKKKPALFEALEKVKSELMLMGFISLLLTVGQDPITRICVPKNVGASWHPCTKERSYVSEDSDLGKRRLLMIDGVEFGNARRELAGKGDDKCASQGKASFISTEGIHQLHIFIFVLAIFHILYCIAILALGKFKMRRWKKWEQETKTPDYQFSNDPERFRFTRDTSFGRRHLSFWSDSTLLTWIVCFFRQFIRSISKADYLAMRHGFIMAHLAPQSELIFDFQEYINRSLEEDFKVVVGISPVIWFFAVVFLLFNTHGWNSYFWLPFIPLIIILLVGTKLQVIITRMAVDIMDRGDVIKGVPVVQPDDHYFWFNRPKLLLNLIHFVLFQNAFQLAFYAFTLYKFGINSCFHDKVAGIIIRISMGVLIQILCSYVTLPLYALVTQMGSNLKPVIFNERVAAALRKWHQTARKHIKENQKSGSVTPTSTSRQTTPTRHFSPAHSFGPERMSPVHLLRYHQSEMDSVHVTTRNYISETDRLDIEKSISSSHQAAAYASYYRYDSDGSSHNHGRVSTHENTDEVQEDQEMQMGSVYSVPPSQDIQPAAREEHISVDFSFDKRLM